MATVPDIIVEIVRTTKIQHTVKAVDYGGDSLKAIALASARPESDGTLISDVPQVTVRAANVSGGAPTVPFTNPNPVPPQHVVKAQPPASVAPVTPPQSS